MGLPVVMVHLENLVYPVQLVPKVKRAKKENQGLMESMESPGKLACLVKMVLVVNKDHPV